MKINKDSKNYLKTKVIGITYKTDNGTETIRELHISGSDKRVYSEAGWLKGQLLP